MILKIFSEKSKDIEKYFDKALTELERFFGFSTTEKKPILILVNDRKTIDALRKTKTEEWFVGWAKDGNIYVLCPENYESESNHRYSTKEYYALIKHELCHIIAYKLCEAKDKIKPRWLWEGIAIYLSGQNKLKKPLVKFNEFTQFYDTEGKGIYYESGFAVGLLIEKFGKEKFFKLLKNLKNIKSEKEFNRYFKIIYCFEPTLKNFNELLKEK